MGKLSLKYVWHLSLLPVLHHLVDGCFVCVLRMCIFLLVQQPIKILSTVEQLFKSFEH